jgi:hypothetical protein
VNAIEHISTETKGASGKVGRSALRRQTVTFPWLELVAFDYLLCCEINLRRAPLGAVATQSEVGNSARRLFLAAQRELARRGVGFAPVMFDERADLFRIWSHINQAQRAASRRPGRWPSLRWAKQLQLDAIGGEQPLTVCVGRLFRDGLGGYGEGCGRIFAESATGNRFARWCSGCRRNRNFERELDARQRARAAGRFPVRRPDASYLFFGMCACGERFTTESVHQMRCEKCRRGHRGPPRDYVRTSAD